MWWIVLSLLDRFCLFALAQGFVLVVVILLVLLCCESACVLLCDLPVLCVRVRIPRPEIVFVSRFECLSRCLLTCITPFSSNLLSAAFHRIYLFWNKKANKIFYSLFSPIYSIFSSSLFRDDIVKRFSTPWFVRLSSLFRVLPIPCMYQLIRRPSPHTYTRQY